MAASTHSTQTLGSEKFVESCGAILFDLRNTANIQVCLVQHTDSGQWLLAKGRRNQGESRKDAAIREVMEETGFRCRLLPLTMPTRATGPDDHADIEDKARIRENLTEPFMCQIRTLRKQGTKIIWWFVATLEDDGDEAKLPGEAKWKPEFMTVEKALTTLHFANDRDLLRNAFALVGQTISVGSDDHKIGEVVRISKTAAKKAAKLAKAVKRSASIMEEEQREEPSVKISTRKMKAQKRRQQQRLTKGMTVLENSSSEHTPPTPLYCSKVVQSTDVHPEPTEKGVEVKEEAIKQRSESERRRHDALLMEAKELVQQLRKLGGEDNRSRIPAGQSLGHNGQNTAAEKQAPQASTITQLHSPPWVGNTLLGILKSP